MTSFMRANHIGRMKAYDTSSMSTVEEPRSSQAIRRQGNSCRKISLEDFQNGDSLFGVFNLEEYRIMRGFIPGRGKRVRLHYTKLEPFEKVGSVCIVHGYGEQSDDYLQIADNFARNRFVVHMVDMRGFGYSGGHKSQDCLAELFLDLEVLIKCCQKNLPAFLLATGLGAMLALNLLIENPKLPLNGVIVVTPNINYPAVAPSFSERVVKYVCRELMGDCLVYSQVNPTAISKRTDVLKRSIDNGLSYQYIRLSVLKEVEQATLKLLRDASKFSYPLLLYCGAENSHQPVEKVENLFSQLSSKDKTFKCFPHGYHSLHLDDECQVIQEESLRWMVARLHGQTFTKLPQTLKPVNFMPKSGSALKILLRLVLLFGLAKILKALYRLLRRNSFK